MFHPAMCPLLTFRSTLTRLVVWNRDKLTHAAICHIDFTISITNTLASARLMAGRWMALTLISTKNT